MHTETPRTSLAITSAVTSLLAFCALTTLALTPLVSTAIADDGALPTGPLGVPPLGTPLQLGPSLACVADTGSDNGCAKAAALKVPSGVAVSPDGRHAYAASRWSAGSDAITAYARDPVTGALWQLPGKAGCISEDGSDGQCEDGFALMGAWRVAVSPDGKMVYAASFQSDAIAVFARDGDTGEIDQLAGQKGCISGSDSDLCLHADGLFAPRWLAVTPDSKNVYVVSETSNSLVALARSGEGEATHLEQVAGAAGCVVAAESASASSLASICQTSNTFKHLSSVAVSPDGNEVYVTTQVSSGVSGFARDPAGGGLDELAGPEGCISEDGNGGVCQDGRALKGAYDLAFSPDGKDAYVASPDSNAVAILRRVASSGQLIQTTSKNGCISKDGEGGCKAGHHIEHPLLVSTTANGIGVHVATFDPSSILSFTRRPDSGYLEQPAAPWGCIRNAGKAADCLGGIGLTAIHWLSASPDNRHVYAASTDDDGIAVLARNQDKGHLTQLSSASDCVSEDGTDSACVDGRALYKPTDALVSPDGRHLYVASAWSNAVAIFARNKATGSIEQLAGSAGCVSQNGKDGEGGLCKKDELIQGPMSIAISPGGLHVYVVSKWKNAILAFRRDPSSGKLSKLPLAKSLTCVSQAGEGGCQKGKGLQHVSEVSLSPDGKFLYAVSWDAPALTVFSRGSQGNLKQLDGALGCLAKDDPNEWQQKYLLGCGKTLGLAGPQSITLSGDGKNLYIVNVFGDSVAAFSRDPKTGTLEQLPGEGGCLSGKEAPGCASANLDMPSHIAIASGGEKLYLSSSGNDSLVTLDRDSASGALSPNSSPTSCVAADTEAGCTPSTALQGPHGVALTKDGKNLYVAAHESSSLASFTTTPSDWDIAQLGSPFGCIGQSKDPDCLSGNGMSAPYDIALSPDQRYAYVTSVESNSVAVLALTRFGESEGSPSGG